uniref:Uncharacterized protein n=1 Tax=Varanus komodoensis TaxID=61221 RepID=A0A8D2JDH0_VARKO
SSPLSQAFQLSQTRWRLCPQKYVFVLWHIYFLFREHIIGLVLYSRILEFSLFSPQISKEFEEEVIPGFTVVRSKEHIDVTLGEEFFERKKPSKESLVGPGCIDVITDLVEQIAELTAMMEQLRRDHQATHKQLEKDMEEKCNEMQEEHEKKMRPWVLWGAVSPLLPASQRISFQRTLKSASELSASGRLHRIADSISDEMEEKWLRRQAEWKKSERTEREKALLQQKQSLTKKFELEIEEQKKIIQNNSFLIGKAYEQEREVSSVPTKEHLYLLHSQGLLHLELKVFPFQVLFLLLLSVCMAWGRGWQP